MEHKNHAWSIGKATERVSHLLIDYVLLFMNMYDFG